MKKLLMLLLASSCSLFRSEPNLSQNSREVPGWVYAPYESCIEAQEFCATGEAPSFKESDGEARNNLASIFEVQIKSDFSVLNSSSDTAPWKSSVRQVIQHSLSQSVDQILEGVQIKDRYKSEDLSYSLASLDRQKASSLIGDRLTKKDAELSELWKNRSRLNLRKIIRIYLDREKLNEKYSIVSGSGRPSPVSFQEIIEWRESKPPAEELTLKIGQAPDWLKEKLKELLTEAGFKLINGNAKRALSFNVDSIKEYLNVEGFEKYTFSMKMMSFRNGQKSKVIIFSETVMGRNQTDALLKVKPAFEDYLEQRLSDLNLD